MPNPALIATLLRELVVARSLPREPEPALVMDDAAQVAAYAEAGRIDGVMAAAYLFHSARISQVIPGCKARSGLRARHSVGSDRPIQS